MRPFPLTPVLATCCLLALPGGHATADDESDTLRRRIQQLEAQNEALRSEVKRLGGTPETTTDESRRQADIHRLADLERRLAAESASQALKTEAAALAERLPPKDSEYVIWLRWRVLSTSGALRDGMTIEAAEKLLGPPTDRSGDRVGWYTNVLGRHVAPFLGARVKDGKLSGWALTKR